MKLSIELDPEILRVVELMAKETGRSRKAMAEQLIKAQLKALNYKPQLSLIDNKH